MGWRGRGDTAFGPKGSGVFGRDETSVSSLCNTPSILLPSWPSIPAGDAESLLPCRAQRGEVPVPFYQEQQCGTEGGSPRARREYPWAGCAVERLALPLPSTPVRHRAPKGAPSPPSRPSRDMARAGQARCISAPAPPRAEQPPCYTGARRCRTCPCALGSLHCHLKVPPLPHTLRGERGASRGREPKPNASPRGPSAESYSCLLARALAKGQEAHPRERTHVGEGVGEGASGLAPPGQAGGADPRMPETRLSQNPGATVLGLSC